MEINCKLSHRHLLQSVAKLSFGEGLATSGDKYPRRTAEANTGVAHKEKSEYSRIAFEWKSHWESVIPSRTPPPLPQSLGDL